MDGRQPIEVPFPLKGINEQWAFRRQPPGTAPDALNVRPFDSGERVRGGQRGGLAKYFAAAVNGTEPIQALGHVTTPASVSAMTSGALYLSETCDATLDSGEYNSVIHSNATGPYNNMSASSYFTVTDETFYYASRYMKAIVWETPITANGVVLNLATRVFQAGRGQGATGFIVRGANNGGSGLSASQCSMVYLDSSNQKVYFKEPSGTADANAAVTIAADTTYELTVEDTRTGLKIYVDGLLKLEVTTSELGANNYFGFFDYGWATNSNTWVDNITFSDGVFSAQPPTRRLIVASGGSLYTGLAGSTLALATDGSAAFAGNRPLRMTEAFGSVYFANGLAAGYKVLTASSTALAAWTPSAGALPVGSADAAAGATLIALYRGRIVLSGLFEEPHNWFMSRAGDPLDWDTGGTVNATMPVVGNNSDAGLLGDVITALIPYSDDLLIFGGAQSLWVLRGDPAAGGVIDNISYQIGVAGSEAYAWDPFGTLYFYGSGSLWRMAGGLGVPESLTDSRLAATFDALDPTAYQITLVWDTKEDGLHIYLIPSDRAQPGTAPVHWFWDRRTDSFWQDQFPVGMGPSAVHYFPADDPDDRAVLLGGYDSYIRRALRTTTSDDGTVIGSYVDFTPIIGAGDLAQVRLIELAPILGADSDDVTLKVYAGDSAEAVVGAATPLFTRTLVGGRNGSVRNRIVGNALRIRLQNEAAAAAAWSLDSMTGVVEIGGKVRRRRS